MLTLTQSATAKIAEAMASEGRDGGSLRIYVQGGGCSGFQYRFVFDEPRENDQVTGLDGFTLLLDPLSGVFLEGASVDYVDGPDGAGFRINNPNQTGTCGCGQAS